MGWQGILVLEGILEGGKFCFMPGEVRVSVDRSVGMMGSWRD